MNLRLTLTSAAAVILTSVSIYPLIQNASWFWAGIGAVIAAAIAGIATRLPPLPAAVATSVLALIAVIPLLTGPSWGLRVLGVIVIAITAASRPRLRLLQVLACPIAYASALLIYLNAVFAPRQSIAGFIPTQASLSYLHTLVSQGLAEFHFEPPVTSTSGIVLVAAAGIGLMAAATDLLAVRLRSPAIAGLPLLALYCVRITTSAKQGGVGATIVFCLGMIGYLALLAADGRERLRIWGRLVTVWQSSPAEQIEAAEAPDTRQLAASGRRIGLAAACIALAVPLVVPGINVHDLLRADSTGTGNGGAPVTTPEPLVQMRQQLTSTTAQTVLTYTTNAKHPQYQYLQVYVLNYNGSQTWGLVLPTGASAQVGSGQQVPDYGVARGTPVNKPFTKITLSQGTVGYDAKLGVLPVPYAPTKLNIQENGWLEDGATQMVYATDPELSGLVYSVTSTEVARAPKQQSKAGSFPSYIRNNYLYFPSGPHGELATLARQITSGAKTPYQMATKLQDYFLDSGKFSYSLSVNLPSGIRGLTEFLYSTHTGYCQQFAFAMAGLARLVGIPSRIAVGYTAGTNEGKGTWKVTTGDAHAWPELYFNGMGWLRFEPTPGGATGQGTATVPQYASGGSPPQYGTEPTTVPTTPVTGKLGRGASANLFRLHHPDTGTGGAAGPISSGGSIVSWVLLALAIVAALALIAPLAARWLIRRRRLRAAGDAALAHAAWRELRDDLADYGLTCRPSESPRAAAARIGAALELDQAASEALGRIVTAEERARYATAPLPSRTLRADSAAVRQALAQEADWSVRWRARLLPASMIAPVRPALQHALDIFGWMDAAGFRFRGGAFRGGAGENDRDAAAGAAP
jgi:transglutaminase-like putative cysteine protease